MASELREGTIIDGKYRIGRRLAEGGMGVVFIAEHLFLKKAVALKVLHAQLSVHPEAIERFTVEARAASLIDHENVVRISDFGRAEGQLYLVMELLDGRDLADEIEREGPLTVTRARFIAAQMLRGLQAAHARGVIHRDLKPENVFICRRPDSDDLIKILDFGIARMRPDPNSDVRLTKDGTVMGTPLYMAPEQLKGTRDVDTRSDLYAVGIILYEMLAGTPPYSAGSFSEIAHLILEGRPRPLNEVAPRTDLVLSSIVMKAFAPSREARFQSAGELLAAIERHRIDEPLGSVKSPWEAPRISQLGDLPGPDNTTVRDRASAQLPMTLAATLDGSPHALLDQPTESFAVVPPKQAPALVPTDEPALELDRPPPAPRVEVPPVSAGRTLLLIAMLVILLGAAAGAYFLLAEKPPASVTIRVFDLPRGAHVFVDGAPSSASFSLPADHEQHRVRLQAPGYADKGLLFVPDENQTLDGKMTRSH